MVRLAWYCSKFPLSSVAGHFSRYRPFPENYPTQMFSFLTILCPIYPIQISKILIYYPLFPNIESRIDIIIRITFILSIDWSFLPMMGDLMAIFNTDPILSAFQCHFGPNQRNPPQYMLKFRENTHIFVFALKTPFSDAHNCHFIPLNMKV